MEDQILNIHTFLWIFKFTKKILSQLLRQLKKTKNKKPKSKFVFAKRWRLTRLRDRGTFPS